MRRSYRHPDVKKLDCLDKAYEIVKAKVESLRAQFRERHLNETSPAYKELNRELESAEETETFLLEEISQFERSSGLLLIKPNPVSDNFSQFKRLLVEVLLDMPYEGKENHFFYTKYKEDDRLYDLYLKSMAKFNTVLDIRHFQELVIYLESEKSLNEVNEAHFEFTILDKEDEGGRELNAYKVLITCDNGSLFEVFVNGYTEHFFHEKLYTKNYETSYDLVGTHIEELIKKFNFLKIMKTLVTTGIENKKYKLPMK